MNKLNFIIILISIISICLLYKYTYKKIEKFQDVNDINADIKSELEKKALESSKEESDTNNYDILQTDSYLKTINNILMDKVDVVDSKISDKLKQFETNEINFHTIFDKNTNKAGSMNICNTTSAGDLLCSHIAHTNGSTYIRPGKTTADIWINKAKNINMYADTAAEINAPTVQITGKQNVNVNAVNTNINSDNNNIVGKKSTNICTASACSHFPWAGDNNTYIRSGTFNNDITIGEARNINLQANQITFRNKNGSASESVTVDDIKKMKLLTIPSVPPPPVAPVAPVNTQIIKTGVAPSANLANGRIYYNYTFNTIPVVVANIDDALPVPSSFQIMNIYKNYFEWTSNTRGSIYRTIKWVAIGT